MKKMTRVLSLVLAMVLCVGVGVGATLAWLTNETKTVKNTFVEGKIIDDPDKDFILSEHTVTEQTDGSYKLNDENLVPVNSGNEYTVLPGADLPKDPFVRVKVMEDAYLFVTIDDTNFPAKMHYNASADWAPLMDEVKHEQVKLDGKKVFTYVGGEGYIKPALEATEIAILDKNHVTVDNDFEFTTGSTFELNFQAYLVQHNGPKTPLQAWNESFGAAKK